MALCSLQLALKHSCPQNLLGGSPNLRQLGHASTASLSQPGEQHIWCTSVAAVTSSATDVLASVILRSEQMVFDVTAIVEEDPVTVKHQKCLNNTLVTANANLLCKPLDFDRR